VRITPQSKDHDEALLSQGFDPSLHPQDLDRPHYIVGCHDLGPDVAQSVGEEMPLIPVALDRSERMLGAAAAVPLRAPSGLPRPTENDEKEAP